FAMVTFNLSVNPERTSISNFIDLTSPSFNGAVNVEDTLQRTSVTLAAASHDAWAADVCATPC
ncbi:MAG: hypothetical protein ACO4CP_12665, partial [Steroidobacteraceae bacterium]